ncbi:MAG: IPTL-CTERM sorting domain-containing protein, partial [Thermodesulfobacteriota bacterium]
RTSTSILRVTVPGSVVSIAVPEAPINDAVGETADLEGGIAVDPDLNIYLVDSDSDDLVSCRPGGPCFLLTSEEEFEDAANVDDVELDEPILLVGDKLYIAEDEECMCIFVVDINTGVPELFLSESQLAAALNGESPDPEGGLAVDAEGRIYIGNDDEEVLGSSILRTGPDANTNQLSLFVTSAEMAALYNPADNPEFDADMCIIPVLTSNVPTLSEWGMVVMAGILGIVGFMVIRRRKTTA